MSNERNRDQKNVYFIDSRIMTPKPFVVSGTIYDVGEKRAEFIVQVSQSDFRRFRIRDFYLTVFTTEEEAQALIDKLPIMGQKVYVIEENWLRVRKTTVDYYDIPKIYFKYAESEYIYEIGKKFFTDKDEAFAALEALKKGE